MLLKEIANIHCLRLVLIKMNIHDATEQAYKNGYAQGLKDAVNHARWIIHNPLDPFSIYGECSHCGFCQSISKYLNYCPDCGYRMDG